MVQEQLIQAFNADKCLFSFSGCHDALVRHQGLIHHLIIIALAHRYEGIAILL